MLEDVEKQFQNCNAFSDYQLIPYQQEGFREADRVVNLIAIDVQIGELVDPFRGEADLKAGMLRHTREEAFNEDPLMVYRVARCAAQSGFSVHAETKALMMRLKPDLESLEPERVFEEMKKALISRYPDKFFRELDGLLDIHFQEIEAIKVPDKHDGTAFEHTMSAICRGHGITERFALLAHDLGKGLSVNPPVHHGHEGREHLVRALGQRLRMPNSLVDFGCKNMRLHMKIKNLHEIRPGKLIRLVEPDIFKHLRLSYLESNGRYERKLYIQHVMLAKEVIKTKNEVTGKILIERGVQPGPFFEERLLEERIKALRTRARFLQE